MNVREKFLSLLVQKGLHSSEAEEVLMSFLSERRYEAVLDRLSLDSDNAHALEVIKYHWGILQTVAVSWIDANAPQHPARAFLIK